ncbi:ABC transporter substrate-binding protein [Dongshaea marina]|uniref:ABC transporter substrate-binding protein n=1 Tax=Dongshaea marina TaxID=2047966 RepID=UPI00131F0275|nr:ABC transporter substrate binding protein [Dongshaea marina]
MRSFTTLLGALLLTLCWGVASAKSVLVIESYHAEYPWDASYMEGLKKELGSGFSISSFEMDTKRVPKSEYQAKADAAWAEYQKMKPDLVVLGDDNALKFLFPKFKETQTPVVFLGINSNPRDLKISSAKNFTGVLERPLFKRSVAELKKILKPAPKKMMVLFDSGNTSKAAVAKLFAGQTSTKIAGVTVDLKLIGKLDDWKKTVSSAKADGYDAIIVGLYHTLVDSAGKHVPAGEVLSWTSKDTPVPVFSFWDFAVGADKTAGGLVLFGQIQGEEAGKLVKKILVDGASPSSLKPQAAEKGRFLFSKAQLAKWKITLPASIEKKANFTD